MSIEESYEKFLIEFNNHLSSIKQKATLVGVSKTKPLDDIVALYKLGLRDFGENYAQELRDKIKDTIEEYKDIKWHYIGNIQENKIKYVAGKAHLIHTVDTLKKAGKSVNDVPEHVTSALTRDYSDLMKAMNKK